jgi:hypothetical protein
MEGLDFTAGGKIKPGTVLASGGPVDGEAFMNTARDSGFVVEYPSEDERQVVFQMHVFDDRKTLLDGPVVDPVSAIPIFLGGNNDPERWDSFLDGPLSIPYLFGSESPHGDYVCWGATCAEGDRSQPALEAARPDLRRPIFIDIKGNRERAQ